MADNRVVIDASAAIHGSLIQEGFAGWPLDRFVAPTLLWSEVASGLNQLRWRGEISDDELTTALVRFTEAPIDTIPSRDLIAEATALAKSIGWAKTYDAEYVVLAQGLGVPLLTLDARLRRSIGHRVPVVSPADLDSAGARGRDSFKSVLSARPDGGTDEDVNPARDMPRDA